MSTTKQGTKDQPHDALDEARAAVAKAAELARGAIGELLPRYRIACDDVARIEAEISRLHRATVPATDLIKFLQDYIDARSYAFAPFLSSIVDRVAYPRKPLSTGLNAKSDPISFAQLECLLQPGGEALFEHRAGDPLYGISDRIPLAGFTMGERMNIDAFCFYFGDAMKAALAAKVGSIAVPPLPPLDQYDETTRAERRVKLTGLQSELTASQRIANDLRAQLESFGWEG